MNNKVLLFILVGLLAIYGLSKMLSGNGDSSFDPQFIKVDKDQATKIVIRSKADRHEKATLSKENNQWKLLKGSTEYPASQEAVDNLLTNLNAVKASYIAAKSSDKWLEYELLDSTSSQLTVYAGEKILTDFYIGKFSVNQQAQQITIFFRTAENENVYAVVGMEGMMLGQGSNNYRDKIILEFEANNVDALQMAGDYPYAVSKSGSGWVLDNSAPLDSTIVRDFLLNLRSMSGDEFVDNFDEVLNGDKLLKTLTITGSNMAQPISVRCWENTNGSKPFVIQSSQYPKSYFASDSTRLFTRIFKPVSEW